MKDLLYAADTASSGTERTQEYVCVGMCVSIQSACGSSVWVAWHWLTLICHFWFYCRHLDDAHILLHRNLGAFTVTMLCLKAHGYWQLTEMLLGSIPWPYKMLSLPIIEQLAEREQYCIFEKTAVPSESSDGINPLFQKLQNFAAALFCAETKTGHHDTFCLFLSIHGIMSSTPRQTPRLFLLLFTTKRDIGLTLLRACFKYSTQQKVRDTSISTLTKGCQASNRLSAWAEWQQGPQLAILQQWCRAAGLKRC